MEHKGSNTLNWKLSMRAVCTHLQLYTLPVQEIFPFVTISLHPGNEEINVRNNVIILFQM